MPELNVVPLSTEPSLQDIPAQLRALASRIESGDYGEVDAVFALIPRERDYPKIMAWGNNHGAFDPIIQFELGRHWLVFAAAGLPTD